jgi:hypothetical protein
MKKGENMAKKKLSEELKHCLESDHCGDCIYYEPETKLTCRGLLQRVYEVTKGYEGTNERIRHILFQLHSVGGCGAQDDYSKGWDEAITEAIRIVEKETGIGIGEVLD